MTLWKIGVEEGVGGCGGGCEGGVNGRVSGWAEFGQWRSRSAPSHSWIIGATVA
jgi:hypothetical protein